VRVPAGAVVDGAIGLGDLVEQRSVEARRAGDVRVGVLVGIVRVTLVAELHEQHEQLVGVLAGELDVLVDLLRLLRPLGALCGCGGALRLAHLDHGAVADLLGLGLSLEHGGDGRLAQLSLLVGDGVGQAVARAGSLWLAEHCPGRGLGGGGGRDRHAHRHPQPRGERQAE